MKFFDSELVRAEMVEISELQEEVYKNVFDFYKMEKTDKVYHINLLQRLLDKQKILYTRLSLSDDPDAVEMKQRISESAVLMGLPENTDMNIVFNSMSNLIDLMREHIDS
jgi:hypothetical protein